ncbi:hypothetical protein IAR50_004322 [Cryptococcus sp. DSM 104548]
MIPSHPSRRTAPPLPLILAALASILPLVLAGTSSQSRFSFDWPDSPRECDVVELTWSGGTPPFEAWVIPVFGQPFIYSIPDSAYADGHGSYPIQLQVGNGYVYTVMMNDANGIGTGGTSEAAVVQPINTTTSPSPSPTSCLRTAALNTTSLDFTFNLAGSCSQCAPGLEMSWTGGSEMEPYNYTLIPLDQGFLPWTVTIPEGETWRDYWRVNMTSGTRFTMIMSSARGYGRGGVAGAYKVDPSPSNTTSCLVQSPLPTGPWPSAATLNTLPTTSLSSSSSSDPSASEKAAANRRALAGRVAGIVVGLLLALMFCLAGGWCWRKKRLRKRLGPRVELEKGSVDLSPAPSPTRTTFSLSSPAQEHEQEPETGVAFFPAVHPASVGDVVIEPYPLDLAVIPSRSGGSRRYSERGEGESEGESEGEDGEGEEREPGSPISTAGSIAAVAPTELGGEWEESTRLEDTKQTHAPSQPPTTASSSIPTSPHSADQHAHEEEGEKSGLVRETSPSSGMGTGGMHLTNPDHPSTPLAPALPLPLSPPNTTPRRRAHPHPHPRPRPEATFRRHADAGPIPLPSNPLAGDANGAGAGGQGEVVVDLPPLYSEVPRDGDYLASSPSARRE